MLAVRTQPANPLARFAMSKRGGLSAKQVRALIKRVGSGRELARRAGVSPGSISKWRKQGVQESYVDILRKAELRAPTLPRYEPKPPKRRRITAATERKPISRGGGGGGGGGAREIIEGYEERIRYLEQRQAELEAELSDAPVVTFETIIQFYRDMQTPPDIDEAMGLADDFDLEISEVYDAYYEED